MAGGRFSRISFEGRFERLAGVRPLLGVGFSVGNRLLTSIVYATIGAVVLLLVIGVVRQAA